jgi:hypothetical protein
LVRLSSPPVLMARLAGWNGGPEEKGRDALSLQKAWSECSYEKRIFPLDWDAVRALGAVVLEEIPVSKP